MRTRRADLYLYWSAAAAMAILAAPVPVYWDSFGYVAQAMSGQIGGLGFGRPVFILISHAIARLWFAAGGSAAHLEPVLRVWWAAVSCAAAPITWRLARRAGLSFRAAALAGLAVAVSPAMAHVGGTDLTDGPATAMCVLASLLGVHAVLATWEAQQDSDRRAVALAAAAGVVIGVAIGLREQSMLGAAGLVLLLPIARRGDRLRLGAAMVLAAWSVVALPMIVVWLAEPGYPDTIRTWLRGMAHDRAVMTFGWRDLGLFLLWILSLGPLVTLAAVTAWARRTSPVWRVGSALFAVSAPALVQLVVPIVFRGISYSPRFLLPAFPAALAIPGAWAFDRWMGPSRGRFLAMVACFVLPLVAAAPYVHARAAPLVETVRTLPAMLARVPSTAVVVTGQPCPAIALHRAILAHDAPSVPPPDWQAVCPGWAWPADVGAQLDAARRSGHTVVIDLRPSSWIGTEQQAALTAMRAYAQTATANGPAPDVILWQ